jgi:hypothetical protein
MGEPWEMSRSLLRCRACDRQVSLTAGTVLQDTRKPLRMWFLAMWFVTSQKNGVSALGLQRVLGLGSYETAWTWLHKLRRAMVRPGRDGLSGEIEIDETLYGAFEVKHLFHSILHFLHPSFFVRLGIPVCIAKPARAGAVKVGRRSNPAARTDLAWPHLYSFEHDGPLDAVGMTIRGEPAFRARIYRATTLYSVGPRTRTMMQSCASAAKLRGGGPILRDGVISHGVVRVTATSNRHRQPVTSGRTRPKLLGAFSILRS